MIAVPLHERCLAADDAPAYYTLRKRSLGEVTGLLEAQTCCEVDAGIGGTESLLECYEHEGTWVRGVFDDRVLAGVLCLSWRIGIESPDEAQAWGAYVVPRYRGTAVSRLLMESAMGWCEYNPRIRWMLARVERDNVRACQYLARFGFERIVEEGGQAGDDGPIACMRRRV